MTENIWIVIVVVIGVVVLGIFALFLLRDRLNSANIKGSSKGVELSLKAHEKPCSKVSANKITGNQNVLTAQNGSGLEGNILEGNENKLKAE